MVQVELEGATLHGLASLSFPLAEGHGFEDGAPIGLYHLDEAEDRWVREGEGRNVAGRFEAQVQHFSWWNADEPIAATGCVAGSWSGGPTRFTLYGEDVLIKSLHEGDEGFCLDGLAGADVLLSAAPEDGCWAPASLVSRSTLSGPGTSCRIDRSACAALTWVPVPCDDGAADAPDPLVEEVAERAAAVEAAPPMTAKVDEDGEIELVEEEPVLMRKTLLIPMIGKVDTSDFTGPVNELGALVEERRWEEALQLADSLLALAEERGWSEVRRRNVALVKLEVLQVRWTDSGASRHRDALHHYTRELIVQEGVLTTLGQMALDACRKSGPAEDCF